MTCSPVAAHDVVFHVRVGRPEGAWANHNVRLVHAEASHWLVQPEILQAALEQPQLVEHPR
eukprot:8931333-Pyramimonas_sp.AAC.2